MKKLSSSFITVGLFAIAMGLLETIVVIYLRELYYPEGFSFPVKAMSPHIVSTELLRELATMVMLLAIGIIAGRNSGSRFAWFLFSFAIWDIFYYIFLKLLVNWPESMLSWDILFLIPVTWVGPVLAPVINSLTMILLSVVLIRANRTHSRNLNFREWLLLILGSLIIIYTYIIGYLDFMLQKFSLNELFDSSKMDSLITYASTYIPSHFDWYVFSLGLALHFTAIGLYIRRLKPAER